MNLPRTRSRRWRLCAAWFLLLLLCFWPVRAPGAFSDFGDLIGHGTSAAPAATAGAGATSVEEKAVAEKKAAVEQELAKVRAEISAGGASDSLQQAQDLLESLDLLFEQHLGDLKEAAQREAALQKAREDLEKLQANGLSGPPPYSLVRLDQVRDEIDAERKRAEMTQVAIHAAQDALARAQDQQSEAESARRAAKEALQANSDPSKAASLQSALFLAQLHSRLADEQARRRDRELRNEKLAGQLEQVRTTALRRQAELLKKGVRFTRDELQQQLAHLDKRKDGDSQALQSAKSDLAAAERQWAKARQKAAPEAGGNRALDALVEARRLAQQTQQIKVNLLSERLQRLKGMRDAWQQRYGVISGAVSRSQLAEWKQKTQDTLDSLDREIRVQRDRLRELQDERLSRSQELDSSVPADVARWIREQERQLDDRIRTYEASLSSLDGTRDLYQNLQGEIQGRLGTKTLGEHIADIWHTAKAVWSYELGSIDDRPITVGKIVTGILLFSLGLWLAGYLSRLLSRRVFPRLGLAAGAAAALESISFYVFVTAIALIALRIINVPLTAFTLAGGALAIGLGFGSQNIVNNFISGLILFAERPIRIGDMIEVDGTYGTVEHIGARSTRVRSFNNIHIIVPNSSFLEKNVVNWTLSDDHVRTMVSVGVAYGSPTREVERLIRQAVDEHKKVLNQPQPMVLFADFGDNSLNFEVHFWLRMRTLMERRLVESDLRYRIDELFREAGITIAFPQRDVHLDTLRPLDVRVVGDGKTSE